MTIVLPIHPRTGLTALGLRRDGRPIWPVIGAQDPPGPPADPPAPNPPAPTPPAPPGPPADPPKPDDPLGPAGLKALQEERDARKALEKRLATLAPLEKFAAALAGDDAGKPTGKTDVEQLGERLANHETELANERAARWRAEVAHERGLTPAQAARLTGSTRDELLADADALLALFPAAAPAAPGTPKPDPSQGARGGGPTIDARIAEAQAKGDWRTVISLQNEKLANL